MIFSKRSLFLFCILVNILNCQAQELKVSKGESPKIYRNSGDSIATVIFKSSVKCLSVRSNANDPDTTLSNERLAFLVNVNEDLRDGNEFCARRFYLDSPQTNTYELDIKPIIAKNIYYYNVTLPNKYPQFLCIEYLMNTHSQKGVRIGFGRRYGIFIGFTVGEYSPSGDNIEDVTSDTDLSYAKHRGYIQTTIFSGLRIGLVHNTSFTTFMNIGLGYGQYGRQWENKTKVENSKYFYTDLIKGVDANLGFSFIIGSTSISVGSDAIMSKGKFMMTWQVGIGICLDTKRLLSIKKRI